MGAGRQLEREQKFRCWGDFCSPHPPPGGQEGERIWKVLGPEHGGDACPPSNVGDVFFITRQVITTTPSLSVTMGNLEHATSHFSPVKQRLRLSAPPTSSWPYQGSPWVDLTLTSSSLCPPPESTLAPQEGDAR